MSLVFKKSLRILDLDIENRPLSYWYDGKPTAEITAIATCWTQDITAIQVGLLGKELLEDILITFVKRYDEADAVTGHNIRSHDLPIINGALMEFGLPKLKPKLTCDTLKDMYRKGDIPASQEYLLALFDLSPKVHMTQKDWREANRLTPEGIAKTEKRVKSDVLDHIQMRQKMLDLDLLKPMKLWRP